MPRSVWADMLMSGPGDSGQNDTGEPGPPGTGRPPAYGSGHEGTLGWPSSGLPPLFGQRPVAGERPSFEDGDLPPAGSAYGGHRPLEPGPGGYGFVSPPAPGLPTARDPVAPEAAYRPWEMYETE